MADDLYKDLGVEKNASPEEIKKAYKSKANEHHPDKGGDPEKFHAISLAYTVLSNPKRREQYDKNGNTNKKPNIETQAEQIIYMWLHEILEQDPLPNDFIKEIVDRIESGYHQLTRSKNQNLFRKNKFEKLRGRVSCGEHEVNLVDNAVNKKLNDIDRQLEDIEEQLKVSSCMRELIVGYVDSEKQVARPGIADYTRGTFSDIGTSYGKW